jgi:Rrf2 family protein
LIVKKSIVLLSERSKEEMQLEITTDYAIRALRFLYVQDDKALTAMQIAMGIDITAPSFINIARRLKPAGLLKTIRGHEGGFMLGKPANEISVYDVIVSMQGELRINGCLETGELCAHGEEVDCQVHGLLYGVQNEIVEKFSNLYISDLVSK